MFSAKAVTAATAANARMDVANDRAADNAAREEERKRKAAERLGNIRLFRTAFPNMSEEEAAKNADANPEFARSLFATLGDQRRKDEEAARKKEQDAKDAKARDIAIRLGRTGVEPTDEDRAALAASTNGTAVYARFFEGQANRASRESEGALNRLARERDAARRNRERTERELRSATKEEARVILTNAKEDLKEWMDLHRNDFLAAEDMTKDPAYRDLVTAIQKAQDRVEGKNRDARQALEDDLREAAALEDGGGGESDFDAIDAEVRAQMQGKPETEIQKEVLRRLGK